MSAIVLISRRYLIRAILTAYRCVSHIMKHFCTQRILYTRNAIFTVGTMSFHPLDRYFGMTNPIAMLMGLKRRIGEQPLRPRCTSINVSTFPIPTLHLCAHCTWRTVRIAFDCTICVCLFAVALMRSRISALLASPPNGSCRHARDDRVRLHRPSVSMYPTLPALDGIRLPHGCLALSNLMKLIAADVESDHT